jgi:transposase
MDILGIDIGKRDFQCELLGEKTASKKFENTVKGFAQLRAWLRNRKVKAVHACMEATGGWSEDLGAFLHDEGHVVSIVNPMQIRAFGQSELSRTKTDKADAGLIARFCKAMNPPPWEPPSAQERRLRQLVRRRVAVVEMRTKELLRLEAPGNENVRDSLVASIDFLAAEIKSLEKQIKAAIKDDPDLRGKSELIRSIGGFGPLASATVLSEAPHLDEFKSGKAFSAFAGLCPQERRSGTSVSSSFLTRIGNYNIRRVMYCVAVAAMRCNPVIRAFAQRLRDRGKKPLQIIVAVMRKMLVLAYGVVRSGERFDPTWA